MLESINEEYIILKDLFMFNTLYNAILIYDFKINFNEHQWILSLMKAVIILRHSFLCN